jgi:hypothetical protein
MRWWRSCSGSCRRSRPEACSRICSQLLAANAASRAPQQLGRISPTKHNFPSHPQSLEWPPPEKWQIASMNKDAQ